LVHRNKLDLGTQMLIDELYQSYWLMWQKQDAIHLLLNHRFYLDKNSPIKEFTHENIKNYSFTFGVIARDILKRSEVFI
jgi:hypothetical protein